MNNILPSWADTARGAEAPGYGWVLVDMKRDWKTVSQSSGTKPLGAKAAACITIEPEKVIGKGRFEKLVPFRFTVNETFLSAAILVSPVSDRYGSPLAFTGTIKRVLVDVSDAEFKDLVWRCNDPRGLHMVHIWTKPVISRSSPDQMERAFISRAKERSTPQHAYLLEMS